MSPRCRSHRRQPIFGIRRTRPNPCGATKSPLFLSNFFYSSLLRHKLYGDGSHSITARSLGPTCNLFCLWLHEYSSCTTISCFFHCDNFEFCFCESRRMSFEDNGSKPGLTTDENPLDRVSSYPAVEFAIPPGPVLSKCGSRQIRCRGSLGERAEDANEKCVGAPRDEENQDHVEESEETYPEGGLEAWLVVLGSFLGTIVAFGLM